MTFDINSWPAWEGSSKRVLPHDGSVDEEDAALLGEHGWAPVDYRILPSESIQERATAILHWLEGVRLGTITPNPNQAKFIELEMRACGLHAGKTQGDKPANTLTDEPDDLNSLLDFDA